MLESNPLVLEILKQDRALKMSLFGQREATSTLRHFSSCQISPVEIEKLCHEIVYILNKAGDRNSHEADLVHGLKQTGHILWDHLLTKQVKARLKDTQTPDLILSIDEELINIPWELLFDGSNFLCLNFNLGRVVRTKEQVANVQYRSVQSSLKMMVLANPTNDLKSAYLEGVNIKNQFDRKRSNVRIDFKSTNIDRLYVKKNLRDYDIVHFAGHCEYSQENPRNSGWVFTDGKFSVHDIIALGSDEPLPSLVFSNACYSAKPSPYRIDTDYQEKNYSLAQAFLFSGVRHYIGTIRRIEDPTSLVFSKEFYSQLVSGKSVGESIRSARLKLIKESGISNIAWASYLLYGDPNFALFRTAVRPKKARTKTVIFNRKRIIWAAVCLILVSLCAGLYFWLPTINPSTYFLFLEANNSFKNGSNKEAIAFSSRIIQKDPLFLAAYPLLADAFQREGDRDNALKYYFDYARYSEKKRDFKNQTAAYIKLGWFYQLQGEYQKAMDFYNQALALSTKNKDRLNEATALRKIAVWNIDKGNYDRALELLTKSSEINRSKMNEQEYRYNLACDYFDTALVFTNKEDFAAAKDFYHKSARLFEKLKLKNELSDYYFNLGEICLFEKQYQKALDYYLTGLKLDESQSNKANLASDYDMVGELYVQMDNLKEAERYFKLAIRVSEEINSRPEIASSCHNLGLLYKQLGKKNKSREHLRRAQEIYSRVDQASYDEVKKELLSLDVN